MPESERENAVVIDSLSCAGPEVNTGHEQGWSCDTWRPTQVPLHVRLDTNNIYYGVNGSQRYFRGARPKETPVSADGCSIHNLKHNIRATLLCRTVQKWYGLRKQVVKNERVDDRNARREDIRIQM